MVDESNGIAIVFTRGIKIRFISCGDKGSHSFLGSMLVEKMGTMTGIFKTQNINKASYIIYVKLKC